MGKPLLPVYLGLQYKECPYYIFQGKNHGQHNRGQAINLQTDKKHRWLSGVNEQGSDRTLLRYTQWRAEAVPATETNSSAW